MVDAEISKQLMIRVEDSIGSLAEVTSFIASSGINLIALCAYEVEGIVAIMFVTEDNNAAKRILEDHAFHVQEEEIILLTLDNSPGALQKITRRIAEAGINLNLLYGSVAQKVERVRMVMLTDSNLDVQVILKTEFGRS